MTLFIAMILSRLEYSSQLWSPHLIKHTIEKVQRSFTKFITGMCDCSYSDILSLLKLYHAEETRTLLYNLCLENNRGLNTKFF